MKKTICYLIIFTLCISLTSFSVKPPPHLIVGNWEFVENQMKTITIDNKTLFLKRLAFSSDEFTLGISLLKQKQKDEPKNEIDLDLAYKIYEPNEEFKNPVIVLKNICDKKSIFIFSIIELDKKFLKIKFEKKYSSDNVEMTDEILVFEKTAGPTENWEFSEDEIKIEIELPKNVNEKKGR